MAFGAILGLATAGAQFALGAQSNSIAMEELSLKRQALRDQRDMSVLNYGLGLDQMRREREQERYLREIREENARFQRQEYEERKDQYQQRLNQAVAEREHMIERQVRADQDAAKQQAFMLEQYLDNRELAQEERDFAISQLEIARATAQGERDEDIRRRTREDMVAQIEREFAIEEMRKAQLVASDERMEDIRFRDEIIGRLDGMSAEIESAYETLGPLMVPELLGREDFDEILSRYEENAIANVDRAADRIASQNEAALMTRGLTHSSIGQSARSDLAGRLAQDYDNARLSAIEDALAYISGVNQTELNQFEASRGARAARAEEIMGLTRPTVEAMLQTRQIGSANDYQTPVPIGTGISARGLVSANSYQSPVAIGSGVYSQAGIGSGISTFDAPSIADAYVFDAGTRAVNPATWNITSPQGFFTNAANLQGGIAGQYSPSQWAQNANSMFSEAFATLGGAAGAFDGMSWGSQWQSSQPSAAPAVTPGLAPIGNSVPIPRVNPYR